MAVAMGTQQAKALLFSVVAVVFTTFGAQGYTTWIRNGASIAIVATTSYDIGASQFINCVIAPGKSEKDEYGYGLGTTVELWVQGAKPYNRESLYIQSDRSLVAKDHGAGTAGVDIYRARYGTLDAEGRVLVTTFLNRLKNETTTNTTTVTTHGLD